MLRYVIGTVYLLFGLTAIPLHALLLFTILSTPQYRNLASYQLMIQIDLGDCVQVATHVYTGLITLVGTDSHSSVEKFVGGFVNAVWISMILVTLLLAINRLAVIGGFQLAIFKCKLFYKCLALLCWLFGLGLFICYMTPFAGLEYNDAFYWSFMENGAWNDLVQNLETLSTIPALIVSFVIYVAIFVIIIVKKRRIFKDNRNALSAQELQLVAQAFIIFSYKTVLVTLWHYGDLILPQSFWTPIAINIMWMCDGCVNPLLYFTINKSVRQRCRDLLQSKRTGPNTKMFTITNNSTRG